MKANIGLATALLMTAGLVSSAAAGSSRTPTSFHSASGNIECRVAFPRGAAPHSKFACVEFANGRTVEMFPTGQAFFSGKSAEILGLRRGLGPVLDYPNPKHWTGFGFDCLNLSSGLQCQNSDGHGFKIALGEIERLSGLPAPIPGPTLLSPPRQHPASPPARAQKPRSSPSGVTKVYVYGQGLVGSIYRENGVLTIDQYGECWIYPASTRAGTVWYAGLTHSTLGGAVPVGPAHPNHWKAWAGRKLLGIIIRKSSHRANLFSSSGKRIGYTLGPDSVAAGAAWFIGCGGYKHLP